MNNKISCAGQVDILLQFLPLCSLSEKSDVNNKTYDCTLLAQKPIPDFFGPGFSEPNVS